MHYVIERRGGLAGLKASCTVDGDAMDPADRQVLEQLLIREEPLEADPGADRYTYRVTRHGATGTASCEIPESAMPHALASAVIPDI